MAYIIRKLLDNAWDMWNTRNHILLSMDGPTKNSIIRKVNTRIEQHHIRRLVGIPERWPIMFNTSLSYIMVCIFRQRLSWMAPISSANTLSIRQTRHSSISTDSLLLDQTGQSRLTPALTKFNDSPKLRSTTFSRNISEQFWKEIRIHLHQMIYTMTPSYRGRGGIPTHLSL